MWGGCTEPRVPIPRSLDGLSRGLSSRIVRHLHRCRFVIFLHWGNMATPAAVNPSGKSVARLLAETGRNVGRCYREYGEGSWFCSDCCWRGLKRPQAAEAWLQHPSPFPHRAALLSAAILHSFAANLCPRMIKRLVCCGMKCFNGRLLSCFCLWVSRWS